MNFSELRLAQPILRALDREGYSTPTPIQAQAIPHILAGRDVLGCAQTGTGKTAAFALPILHALLTSEQSVRGPRLPRVLVLSPTRELACQIGESFATYGRDSGLSGTIIYGGVSQRPQVRDLQRGVDIIVATPGRLIDLVQQGYVDLSCVTTLVLDEADRMLDMGFIQPIRTIAAETPAERQTLLFSATVSGEIASLARSLMRDPVRVAVEFTAEAAPDIEQSLYHVRRGDKPALLTHLLADPATQRVVVFTKTKHGADRVGERLVMAGITVQTIHGNKAQNARQRSLDMFRRGRARVLVATDVAARGLDVDDVTHVVNYDLPMEPEAYVHRIGRTGRAGAAGSAVSFCDENERGLLRGIERLIGNAIPRLETPREVRADSGGESGKFGPSREAAQGRTSHAPRHHKPGRHAGAAHVDPELRSGSPDHHGRTPRARRDQPDGFGAPASPSRTGYGRDGESRSRDENARPRQHNARVSEFGERPRTESPRGYAERARPAADGPRATPHRTGPGHTNAARGTGQRQGSDYAARGGSPDRGQSQGSQGSRGGRGATGGRGSAAGRSEWAPARSGKNSRGPKPRGRR